MPQRNLGRALTATVLAVTLSFALAAPAAAAPRGGPQDLWSSLLQFLESRLAPVWRLARPAEPANRPLGKEGGCVDSNGCAQGTAATPAALACAAWNEQGGCIDPNG
jgi:hypothetical protein